MKKITLSMLAAGAALATFAAPAQAAVTPCALTDISPTAIACRGFFAQQQLGGNNLAFQEAKLAEMGLSIDLDPIFGTLTNLSGLGGVHHVALSKMIYGITYIGMHFGGGQGGPGNATAFYKFDAGVSGMNLNEVTWAYNASSDLILYSTGSAPAVPEPASWALLIAGMGAVGFSMRRRKVDVAFA